MSSTQDDAGSIGVSQKIKKPTGNRRSWTLDEETILIASVKEIIGLGWKSDNDFRAGYLNKLEDAMEVHFPSTDLKGTPHINSKLSTWKKNYYSLSSILSKSGVGFNLKGNHMINCTDDFWAEYVKIDPNVKMMRYKMWPYYDDWKEIFGKDRANGEMAEDIPDAWNEMWEEESTKDVGAGEDYDVSLEDLAENEGAGDNASHTQRGAQAVKNCKKRKLTDEVSGLCEALAEFGRMTSARLASLVESIGYESRLGQTCEGAFQELRKIEGLMLEQKFDVCEILSANVDKVKIFKGLPESARPQYVQRCVRTMVSNGFCKFRCCGFWVIYLFS